MTRSPSIRTAWPALAGLVLLALACAAPAEAGGASSPPLVAPVAPVRAVALFDPPERPWLAGHRGIDLATAVDASVLAPGSGIVTFAGRVVDRGVITIDHGALRSSLEPVAATVAVGEAVVAGQAVGTVTDSPGHCAPETCVHWGVRLGDRYVDPLDVLEGFGPIVLLPHE